jgi:hypothetical protein
MAAVRTSLLVSVSEYAQAIGSISQRGVVAMVFLYYVRRFPLLKC